MGENLKEKKEERESTSKKIFTNVLIFMIIGIALGLIFSFFLEKFLYLIFFALGGIIFGILHTFYSSAPPSTKKAINIFVIVIIILLVVFFAYMLTQSERFEDVRLKFSFFYSFFSFFKKGFEDLHCVLSEECITEMTQPTQQYTTPDFQVSIEYEDDYIKDGTIDMFIKLSVINKKLENLALIPYCHKELPGENREEKKEQLIPYSFQSYSLGKKFVFPKSQQEMNTGFRCRGETIYQFEKIVVGFDIPYSTTTLWRIYTATKPQEIENKKGIQISEESPYTLFIDFPSDMPLKDGEYEFFIKLKKNYDVELKEINKIYFEFMQDTNILCMEKNEIEIKSEDLNKYKGKDGYVFPCKLTILGATSLLEERTINVVANYIVYKEFEKMIKKK